MWIKHVFLLYISWSSLKKELTHAYGLTLMSLFIKIMMGYYESCPLITPKSVFWRGNYGTPFLTIQRHIVWNQFYILKDYYLFVFITQTNKLVFEFMVLILIEQNVILKKQNQNFPQSEIEYVIVLLTSLVRLILFLILVVYRSTYWQFSGFYFVRNHFNLSRFYPIILIVTYTPSGYSF